MKLLVRHFHHFLLQIADVEGGTGPTPPARAGQRADVERGGGHFLVSLYEICAMFQ